MHSKEAMKHFDIFGNVLPRWVCRLAPSDSKTSHYCLTYEQLLHLGVMNPTKPLQFVNFVSSLDWCSACVTQCRQHKYIHERRGEAWSINITTPYLSIRGTPLTEDMASILKLNERTDYSLPFWITENELFLLSQYLPDHFIANHSADKFHTRSVRIRKSFGEDVSVINIQEVMSKPSSMNMTSCLSLFRIFDPINVKNRQAFSSSIALLLRIQCWKTRCWCSIWGTEEDFTEESISCFEGALSINVFTKHGNELQLTNALRTTNSAEAYRIVFPETHLTFFC